MKKEYTRPEIDVNVFEAFEDILLSSAGAGGVTDGGSDWEGWL